MSDEMIHMDATEFLAMAKRMRELEAENKSLKNDEEFAGMDAAIQRLKAENAALKAELNAVDLALVRRDALDGIPHRYDKILKCIEVAKQADGLRAKLERAEKALLLIETIQVNMGSVDCARIAARYRYSEETK